LKISIHGFNVKDPEKTVGKLKKYVKNLYVFNYGYLSLLDVLFKNKSKAKDFARFIKGKEPVTVYAHSNGAAVSVIAARKYNTEIKNLICIGAALNVNAKFPESIQNILVLSTKHDKATRAARFFDSIPFIELLVPDVWGNMGGKGYTGKDDRVTNVYLDDTIGGHSDYFSDEDLPEVTKIIDDWLEKLNNNSM